MMLLRKLFQSNVDLGSEKGTGRDLLKHMKIIRIIIPQDTAAIYKLHPSCMICQLCDVIAIFKTKQFKSYCTEMKQWMSEAEDWINTSINLAIIDWMI